VKALILAANNGQRLRSKFPGTPKALLPGPLGKPMIEILLDQLKEYEVTIATTRDSESALLPYGAPLIVEDKLDGNANTVRRFAETAGQDFLVVYCDCYSDIDFAAVVDFHAKRSKIMTLTVKEIAKARSFGIAVLNKKRDVVAFTRRRQANCGVYVFKPDVSEHVQATLHQDIDKHLIPRLIRREQVTAYAHNGFWFDIATKAYWSRRNEGQENQGAQKVDKTSGHARKTVGQAVQATTQTQGRARSHERRL
jgi:NDP-sugar pyrophosphorylase family protein